MKDKNQKIAVVILTIFICVVLVFFSVGSIGGCMHIAELKYTEGKYNNVTVAYAESVQTVYTSPVIFVPYVSLYDQAYIGLSGLDLYNSPFNFIIRFNQNSVGNLQYNLSFSDYAYTDYLGIVGNVASLTAFDLVNQSLPINGIKSQNVVYFTYDGFGDLYITLNIQSNIPSGFTDTVPLVYGEGFQKFSNNNYCYTFEWYFDDTHYFRLGFVFNAFTSAIDDYYWDNNLPLSMRYYNLNASESQSIIVQSDILLQNYKANELPTLLNTEYRKGYADGVTAAGTDGNWRSLMNAVFYAPIHAFASLFNFEIWGVNVLNIVTGLFGLLIVSIVIKLILGGL